MPGPIDRWTSATRFLDILDDEFYRLLVDLQHQTTMRTMWFWDERGLRNLHLPVTTASISSPMGLGSDSAPVSVEMFGVPTYLADSMQFLLEYGCRLSPSGAFYLMPSFRGEEADETHLCQFFHSEAEMPGGLDDVIDVAQTYVVDLTRHLLETLGDELGRQLGSTAHLEAVAAVSAFPRVTFDEAVNLLVDRPAAIHHDEGWRTLTRAGERLLMERIGGPLWVTHWDHLAVPFYQAYDDQCRDDQARALNGDLLLGLGEVLGCGERHVTAARARRALAHHAVDERHYAWYLQLKDSQPLRTAGFGMGVERYLAFVLQHGDVRDLQLLTRFNGVAVSP